MNITTRFIFLVGVVLTAATTFSAAEPALKITWMDKTVTFSPAEIAALPHLAVATPDPYNQTPRHFSGVPVSDLLARAGVPLGDKLRGPALQLVVVVRAKDNYTAVFALAEFDEQFSSRTVLLADQESGKPLDEKSGPFQLVAPGDKKAARWVRLVTSIEVLSIAAPSPVPTPSTPR